MLTLEENPFHGAFAGVLERLDAHPQIVRGTLFNKLLQFSPNTGPAELHKGMAFQCTGLWAYLLKRAALVVSGPYESLLISFQRPHGLLIAMGDQAASYALEFDDLYNSGYIALVAATDSYGPEAGALFITWFAMHLKTAFAEAGGWRTRRQKQDPLNNSTSMDKPIGEEDDGGTLGDFIPDPSAVQAFQDVEERLYLEQLHAALERAMGTLEADEEAFIRARYYQGRGIVQSPGSGWATGPAPALSYCTPLSSHLLTLEENPFHGCRRYALESCGRPFGWRAHSGRVLQDCGQIFGAGGALKGPSRFPLIFPLLAVSTIVHTFPCKNIFR